MKVTVTDIPPTPSRQKWIELRKQIVDLPIGQALRIELTDPRERSNVYSALNSYFRNGTLRLRTQRDATGVTFWLEPRPTDGASA